MASEETAVEAPRWRHLVGHGPKLAAWRELIAGGRLPPVLLLEGREGSGKRGLLAALVAMHFCETGAACGECKQCRWLASGSHPEVLWLESSPESGKLPLATADALREHLELSPTAPCRYRIVVVVDADQLATQAANRLLKTLEEPPPRARILMSSSRPKAMLATVLSRTVRWRVTPPTVADSLAWLDATGKAAGAPPATPEFLLDLLKRAGLAPGEALRLWRQGDDGQAGSSRLTELMCSSDPATITQAAEALVRDGGVTAPALLREWEMQLNASYARGEKPRSVARVSQSRELLGELKRLVLGGRVPLNAQLAAECLALNRV